MRICCYKEKCNAEKEVQSSNDAVTGQTSCLCIIEHDMLYTQYSRYNSHCGIHTVDTLSLYV